MNRVWLVLAVLLPSSGPAMQATCSGCPDNCCQWAYSAWLVQIARPSERTHSIAEYSWEFYETHGYDPVPCQDVIEDRIAYERCALKAFNRCRKQFCCEFRLKQRWSWRDFIGIGEFPGYEELNARLEKERLDEELEKLNRRGVDGTEPVEFYPGQVIVIDKSGVIVYDSKNDQEGVRDD